MIKVKDLKRLERKQVNVIENGNSIESGKFVYRGQRTAPGESGYYVNSLHIPISSIQRVKLDNDASSHFDAVITINPAYKSRRNAR